MEVVTEAIKSHGSKGGGSRYGKRQEVQDLTVEERKCCKCWSCREMTRWDDKS